MASYQVHDVESPSTIILFCLRFHDKYQASGVTSLAHFYRHYSPPITSEHYTCVGLALELLARLANLENRFPGLKDKLYLISCEEVSI